MRAGGWAVKELKGLAYTGTPPALRIPVQVAPCAHTTGSHRIVLRHAHTRTVLVCASRTFFAREVFLACHRSIPSFGAAGQNSTQQRKQRQAQPWLRQAAGMTRKRYLVHASTQANKRGTRNTPACQFGVSASLSRLPVLNGTECAFSLASASFKQKQKQAK